MQECVNYGEAIPNVRTELPSRTNYTIEIQQKSRGYVVNVGCQTFCFSTKEELIPLLTAYINNPNEIEKQWYEGTLFKD